MLGIEDAVLILSRRVDNLDCKLVASEFDNFRICMFNGWVVGIWGIGESGEHKPEKVLSTNCTERLDFPTALEPRTAILRTNGGGCFQCIKIIIKWGIDTRARADGR